MDEDVAALPDAKLPIGRLLLYRWVPPSVEMKYPARGGQVKPGGLYRKIAIRFAL
jgi:hypothetical protein